MENIVFNCPHCRHVVMVNKKDINCAIFRHAVKKDSGKQIDPHSSKTECDSLVKQGKVFGCAKPFRLVRVDSFNYTAEKCDYI